MILEVFLGNSSKSHHGWRIWGNIFLTYVTWEDWGKSLWKGEGRRKRGDYKGDRIPRYIVLLVSLLISWLIIIFHPQYIYIFF